MASRRRRIESLEQLVEQGYDESDENYAARILKLYLDTVSDWELEYRWEPDRPNRIVPYTTTSDYGPGGHSEAAYRNWIRENLPEDGEGFFDRNREPPDRNVWWEERYSGYGGQYIIVTNSPTVMARVSTEDIVRFLEALMEPEQYYDALSDEINEREMEADQEFINDNVNDIHRAFMSELERRFNEPDDWDEEENGPFEPEMELDDHEMMSERADLIEDAVWVRIFWDAYQNNQYEPPFIHEQGLQSYLDIDGDDEQEQDLRMHIYYLTVRHFLTDPAFFPAASLRFLAHLRLLGGFLTPDNDVALDYRLERGR